MFGKCSKMTEISIIHESLEKAMCFLMRNEDNEEESYTIAFN